MPAKPSNRKLNSLARLSKQLNAGVRKRNALIAKETAEAAKAEKQAITVAEALLVKRGFKLPFVSSNAHFVMHGWSNPGWVVAICVKEMIGWDPPCVMVFVDEQTGKARMIPTI